MTTAATHAKYPDRDKVPILTEDNPDDPEGRLWSVYANITKGEDDDLGENWDKDMDVLLIYAGLFSAVVTTFVIEGYKTLSPDPQDVTNTLLSRISIQLSEGQFNQSTSMTGANISFQRPVLSVLYNTLWFLSLTMSLCCALGATLVKQWGRAYLQNIRKQTSISHRARVREFLYQGVTSWHVGMWTDGLMMLLHSSVSVFFVGLVLFIYSQDHLITAFILVTVAVMTVLYTALTVAPLLSANIPFRTPVSSVLIYLLPRLYDRFVSAVISTASLWPISKISEQYADLDESGGLEAQTPHTISEPSNQTVAHSKDSTITNWQFAQWQDIAIMPSTERSHRDCQALTRLSPLLHYRGHWEALLAGLPSYLHENQDTFSQANTYNLKETNKLAFETAKELSQQTLQLYGTAKGSPYRTQVALQAVWSLLHHFHPTVINPLDLDPFLIDLCQSETSGPSAVAHFVRLMLRSKLYHFVLESTSRMRDQINRSSQSLAISVVASGCKKLTTEIGGVFDVPGSLTTLVQECMILLASADQSISKTLDMVYTIEKCHDKLHKVLIALLGNLLVASVKTQLETMEPHDFATPDISRKWQKFTKFCEWLIIFHSTAPNTTSVLLEKLKLLKDLTDPFMESTGHSQTQHHLKKCLQHASTRLELISPWLPSSYEESVAQFFLGLVAYGPIFRSHKDNHATYLRSLQTFRASGNTIKSYPSYLQSRVCDEIVAALTGFESPDILRSGLEENSPTSSSKVLKEVLRQAISALTRPDLITRLACNHEAQRIKEFQNMVAQRIPASYHWLCSEFCNLNDDTLSALGTYIGSSDFDTADIDLSPELWETIHALRLQSVSAFFILFAEGQSVSTTQLECIEAAFQMWCNTGTITQPVTEFDLQRLCDLMTKETFHNPQMIAALCLAASILVISCLKHVPEKALDIILNSNGENHWTLARKFVEDTVSSLSSLHGVLLKMVEPSLTSSALNMSQFSRVIDENHHLTLNHLMRSYITHSILSHEMQVSTEGSSGNLDPIISSENFVWLMEENEVLEQFLGQTRSLDDGTNWLDVASRGGITVRHDELRELLRVMSDETNRLRGLAMAQQIDHFIHLVGPICHGHQSITFLACLRRLTQEWLGRQTAIELHEPASEARIILKSIYNLYLSPNVKDPQPIPPSPEVQKYMEDAFGRLYSEDRLEQATERLFRRFERQGYSLHSFDLELGQPEIGDPAPDLFPSPSRENNNVDLEEGLEGHSEIPTSGSN